MPLASRLRDKKRTLEADPAECEAGSLCAPRARGERGAGSWAAPAVCDTVDLKRSTRGSVLPTPRPGPAVGRGLSESV